MRGREAGQAAETDGAEKAVTGRIAAGTGPAREPGRCAAAREQIRDRLSAGSQDAAVNVDHEAALRMKQSRHHTADIKRADKRSEREVTPAEPIRHAHRLPPCCKSSTVAVTAAGSRPAIFASAAGVSAFLRPP